MATYAKQELTGAADGLGIKVAATATPGTTIHTSHATDYDEIWLWAFNSAASDELLTIEWGGTTDPDNIIEVTIPSQGGLELVIPGLILTNSKVVKAFSANGNVVTLTGYVNRITA